ncbi:MAG: hypothetical protein ACUVQ5_03310 [Candidatus Methanomethylicaceae archaeon]
MKVKLMVDDRRIQLNEFVNQILGGMISGAIMTLRGVNENWKVVKIEISK